MRQFLTFCVVGTIGFVVDAGVLVALVTQAHADPYVARVASFVAAASATWWLNRRYTFAVERRSSGAEWLRYVLFMALGAAINYGAYAAAITGSEFVRAHLWLGVAIGSIAGLGLNYLTSRTIVFRRTPEDGISARRV